MQNYERMGKQSNKELGSGLSSTHYFIERPDPTKSTINGVDVASNWKFLEVALPKIIGSCTDPNIKQYASLLNIQHFKVGS